MILPGFPRPLPMKLIVPYLAIPALTGPNAPSGWSADASSTSHGNPWEAFDQIALSYWQANVGTGGSSPSWVRLSAPQAFQAIKYKIRVSDAPRAPKDFEMQGSNDGLAWDTIDARSGIAWSTDEEKTFETASPGGYRLHRVYITQNQGAIAFTRINEITFLQAGDL